MIFELLSWVVVIVSILCILAGAFCSMIGGLGLVRLPDFYSRLHGGGVTDTAGVGLILVGLMIYSGFNLVTFKLVMILFFFLLTSPSACHALAKAAMKHGVKPELDDAKVSES
ncbi:MAG: monovalent cation/H(+) antiporter subunit G [Pirellula sp.]|jgi:multicomponent Na+:H+ antiporter subunit G|nr:monovalent cation/H(+) antiporter subunit G [Pirellula sp.]